MADFSINEMGRIFFYIFVIYVMVITGSGDVLAEEQKNVQVEIVAMPKSGKGPMWVYLEPKIRNLKETVKIEWYFGDGQESTELKPPPHYYPAGKYPVVLEVTDKTGRKYTASVTIDAASPG